MRIAFFEDRQAANFAPIALMRPVFELLCGRFTLRERALRSTNMSEWGALLRSFLIETYRESHPEAHVNDVDWLTRGSTLLINGRWLPDDFSPEQFPRDAAGICDNALCFLTLHPDDVPRLIAGNFHETLAELAHTRRHVPASGTVLRYPWDLIARNAPQLLADFKHCPPQAAPDLGPHSAVLGPREDVCVDPAANVEPFVVFDARGGPITVDAGATIGAFTQLQGPCHVGRATQLFRAQVHAGTTLGPVCRVGGEIEASILHGYVNKYHAGFLGHSYVCPWVNLGALTTNSDLKNDYSSVAVPLSGEMIDTGHTKVGCFIGDHTKTALGTLLNTGTSVGVMCQLLPGGKLLPKHIPSFARVWHGELTDAWELKRSLATAGACMQRRNQTLSAAQTRLLQHVFSATADERRIALQRYRERAGGLPSRKIA